MMMKYTALLLLGALHSSQALCFINQCSSFWSDAKRNVSSKKILFRKIIHLFLVYHHGCLRRVV